jgi:hypothetical protein
MSGHPLAEPQSPEDPQGPGQALLAVQAFLRHGVEPRWRQLAQRLGGEGDAIDRTRPVGIDHAVAGEWQWLRPILADVHGFDLPTQACGVYGTTDPRRRPAYNHATAP